MRKATRTGAPSQVPVRLPAVEDPEHVWNLHAREPGDPRSAHRRWQVGRIGKARGRTPMTHGSWKSDRPVVPAKLPNNVGRPTAEVVEERGLAEGNTAQQNAPRTQSRISRALSALGCVREAPRKDGRVKFTQGELGARCRPPWRRHRPRMDAAFPRAPDRGQAASSTPLARGPLPRHYPRQEPSALAVHAGICAGGAG
jgi:hypothetical protein